MSTTPIQITGNLTRDPDLHYLPSGRPVARFDVAVNSRRHTETGDWVDGETTYYPCSTAGTEAGAGPPGIAWHRSASNPLQALPAASPSPRSKSARRPRPRARGADVLDRRVVFLDERLEPAGSGHGSGRPSQRPLIGRAARSDNRHYVATSGERCSSWVRPAVILVV